MDLNCRAFGQAGDRNNSYLDNLITRVCGFLGGRNFSKIVPHPLRTSVSENVIVRASGGGSSSSGQEDYIAPISGRSVLTVLLRFVIINAVTVQESW